MKEQKNFGTAFLGFRKRAVLEYIYEHDAANLHKIQRAEEKLRCAEEQLEQMALKQEALERELSEVKRQLPSGAAAQGQQEQELRMDGLKRELADRQQKNLELSSMLEEIQKNYSRAQEEIARLQQSLLERGESSAQPVREEPESQLPESEKYSSPNEQSPVWDTAAVLPPSEPDVIPSREPEQTRKPEPAAPEESFEPESPAVLPEEEIQHLRDSIADSLSGLEAMLNQFGK